MLHPKGYHFEFYDLFEAVHCIVFSQNVGVQSFDSMLIKHLARHLFKSVFKPNKALFTEKGVQPFEIGHF